MEAETGTKEAGKGTMEAEMGTKEAGKGTMEAETGSMEDDMLQAGVRPEDFTGQLQAVLHLQDAKAGEHAPLVLAYIGDAVYELVVRTRVVNSGRMQVNKLHKKSIGLVKAETQARMIKALEGQLTEEEHRIYKRGRNARSVSSAKNATVIEYRLATGFEALIGYLYLENRHERLITLVKDGLTAIGEWE